MQTPKTVYLDTNIWIDLERAQFEHSGGSRDVLEHLITLVKAQSVRLPLSFWHCHEMLKHGQGEKRGALWAFATALSGRLALQNKQKVLPKLIEEAVFRVFGAQLEGEPAEAFSHNGLFGLPVEEKYPLTHQFMEAEEGWHYFWLTVPEEIRERLYAGLKMIEQKGIERQNALKEQWRDDSYPLRKRAYVAGLFLDLRDHYSGAMRRLGKTLADIEALPMKDRIRLVTEVAPLNVEICLGTQHLQQWDRMVTTNDIRDISHLSMAIPFCDVVVTERYWVDKIQREKLDKQYDTLVFSDCSSLLEL